MLLERHVGDHLYGVQGWYGHDPSVVHDVVEWQGQEVNNVEAHS